MLFIRKSKLPDEFVEFNAKNPSAHFDDMPSEVKDSLRNSLLSEQGHLCAYCMCRISPEYSKMKIEHYKPRDPDNELDYRNLLEVCTGNEGEPFEHQHCDTRKRNSSLHLNPQNEAHINQIYYEPDGTIYSRNSQFDSELNLILNLNDSYSHLKNNRKQALDALKRKIRDKYPDKAAPAHFLQSLLDFYREPCEGRFEPYCGILFEYLQRKLRSRN